MITATGAARSLVIIAIIVICLYGGMNGVLGMEAVFYDLKHGITPEVLEILAALIIPVFLIFICIFIRKRRAAKAVEAINRDIDHILTRSFSSYRNIYGKELDIEAKQKKREEQRQLKEQDIRKYCRNYSPSQKDQIIERMETRQKRCRVLMISAILYILIVSLIAHGAL